MNRPILRLYGLVVLMFGLLIAFTSRWAVFDASSLRNNPLNVRATLNAQLIRRGTIVADNGRVLARSVRGPNGVYSRVYPTNSLFAHAVGYSLLERNLGRFALEQSFDGYLTGDTTSGIDSILNQLQGQKPQGDQVVTTLDPGAQQVALRDLAGRPGAVVALDPHTGAVKVFASEPDFNPNTLTQQKLAEWNNDPGAQAPLLDRVTASAYPPGSTFKVLTAIAAIDSGEYTPDSIVNGDSPKIISGVPLMNDGNQSFGDITLTKALTFSVNTVWAQV